MRQVFFAMYAIFFWCNIQSSVNRNQTFNFRDIFSSISRYQSWGLENVFYLLFDPELCSRSIISLSGDGDGDGDGDRDGDRDGDGDDGT